MSTVLLIAIGSRIVASAVAEAVTCENADPEIRNITITKGRNLLNAFIVNELIYKLYILEYCGVSAFLNWDLYGAIIAWLQ